MLCTYVSLLSFDCCSQNLLHIVTWKKKEAGEFFDIILKICSLHSRHSGTLYLFCHACVSLQKNKKTKKNIHLVENRLLKQKKILNWIEWHQIIGFQNTFMNISRFTYNYHPFPWNYLIFLCISHCRFQQQHHFTVLCTIAWQNQKEEGICRSRTNAINFKLLFGIPEHASNSINLTVFAFIDSFNNVSTWNKFEQLVECQANKNWTANETENFIFHRIDNWN